MYLEDEIDRINRRLTQLKGKKNIVIWGAAENTAKLFEYTNLCQYGEFCVVDTGKSGSNFFGKKVLHPDELDWSQTDAVVISAFYRENEIEHVLLQKNEFQGLVLKLNEPGQSVPFYKHLSREELRAPKQYQHILEKNKCFQNRHRNQRIFILCCGPSVKDMDLTVLKDEITMGVHSFYMHKDIGTIRPDYYCNAQWGYNEKWTKEVGIQYLGELKRYVGETQFFFSIQEKEVIENSHIFKPEEVSYYYYGPSTFGYEDIDLCQGIMPVQSVPILCIQLAFYMGFGEIYLIGTDHDFLRTNKYSYFYNREDSVLGKADFSVDSNNNVTVSYAQALRASYYLWEDYKKMREIANGKNVKIWNATVGGDLDLFPRVDFKELFHK